MYVVHTHTIYFIFNYTYVYICVCVYKLAYAHVSQKRAFDFPGAAVTGSCKSSIYFLYPFH